MTTKQLQNRIAIICGTLQETGPAPASSIYLALGMDITAWEMIRGILTDAGLATVTPAHEVRLTPAGEDLGRKCNEVLARLKAQQTA
jgi:predicted transcriptional regulator